MEVRPHRGPVARKGFSVLAPLPRLHRLVVVAIALLAAIAAGLFLASAVPSVPLPVGGVLVGTVAGCLVAFLLVHDFGPAVRPVRVRRPR